MRRSTRRRATETAAILAVGAVVTVIVAWAFEVIDRRSTMAMVFGHGTPGTVGWSAEVPRDRPPRRARATRRLGRSDAASASEPIDACPSARSGSRTS